MKSKLPTANDILEKHFAANLSKTVSEMKTAREVTLNAMREFANITRDVTIELLSNHVYEWSEDSRKGEELSKQIDAFKQSPELEIK
jgi:hypothetical protein